MLIIYVVAFIAIFYFMAIRPQQRQRKAHQALLASLKRGDRIITAAGIYGTVKRVEENIVVVEIAKGVSMKIARRAVAEIIRDSAQARAAAPEPAIRGKAGATELEAPEEEQAADAQSSEAPSGESAEEAEDGRSH
jgi:preprotein translocase subunit YajC